MQIETHPICDIGCMVLRDKPYITGPFIGKQNKMHCVKPSSKERRVQNNAKWLTNWIHSFPTPGTRQIVCRKCQPSGTVATQQFTISRWSASGLPFSAKERMYRAYLFADNAERAHPRD